MSPTHQDLSNDTTFSQIKSRVPVPLNNQKADKDVSLKVYSPENGNFHKDLIILVLKRRKDPEYCNLQAQNRRDARVEQKYYILLIVIHMHACSKKIIEKIAWIKTKFCPFSFSQNMLKCLHLMLFCIIFWFRKKIYIYLL